MRPVLITCGATRNPIDAMRFITARSSGRTGVELARLLSPGVSVLGSEETLLRLAGLPGGVPAGCALEEFGSTRDLMARMEAWVRAHPTGVVVHAAAVGDFELREPSAGKVSSAKAEWTLTLHPTPKIVDRIRGWSSEVTLVSFKAADPSTTREGLVALADAQRVRTHSDVVFANVLGRIASDVVLVSAAGPRWFDRRTDGLAALVAEIASRRLL